MQQSVTESVTRFPCHVDDRADSLPAGLPWADLHPLGPSPRWQPSSAHSPHPVLLQLPEESSEHESQTGDEESQGGEGGALRLHPWLQAALQPALAAWDVASRILSVAEAPLWVLRRATIPLLEAECYSRPWYAAALSLVLLSFVICMSRPESLLWQLQHQGRLLLEWMKLENLPLVHICSLLQSVTSRSSRKPNFSCSLHGLEPTTHYEMTLHGFMYCNGMFLACCDPSGI